VLLRIELMLFGASLFALRLFPTIAGTFIVALTAPPALSGHQNYFLWGPREYSGEVVIVLDERADDEQEQFQSVEG